MGEASEDVSSRDAALRSVLIALQRFQRQPSIAIGPCNTLNSTGTFDRLRLGATLPTLFARAGRYQREAAQRLLQAVMLRASRQGGTRQEPMVQYAVACFLHFLSRLDVFATEAAAASSAFTESTGIAMFFLDVLLKCDPARSLLQTIEVADATVQVCDQMRYYVDREEPDSDHVYKAASVLRYVAERRCPELVARRSRGHDEPVRIRMPAKLFAHRAGATLGPLPLPGAVTAALTPLPPARAEGHREVTPTSRKRPRIARGSSSGLREVNASAATSDDVDGSAAAIPRVVDGGSA